MTIDLFLEEFHHLFNYQVFLINRTPVTLSSILLFVLFMGGLLLVTRMLRKLMTSRLFRRINIPPGTQYMLIRLTPYSLLVIGSVVAFQFIGIDLSGLAVIFGFLSVGIGFGLQNLTSNFIAGIISRALYCCLNNTSRLATTSRLAIPKAIWRRLISVRRLSAP